MLLKEKLNNNLNKLLGVNKPDKIAVAVSGGVDSVALMHLLVNWAKEHKALVTVFAVDHNLRTESKSEIEYIQKLSAELGVDFVALSWVPGDQTTATQERAREGRYNLITNHCKKIGISALLTAHHLGDNLETYLIKKSKKTSVLALKPNITYFWNNVWILRPFFNIEKQELIDYLLKNKITWFEDASNDSDKYERNRVRKRLSLLSSKEKSALLLEYDEAINKAKKLNELLIKSVAEVVSIYNEGFAKIGISQFNGLEPELKIHLLNYVLTIISGKTIVPRYRSLEKVITSLTANVFKSGTLSHCHLVGKDGSLVIYKEKAFVGGGKNQQCVIPREHKRPWGSPDSRDCHVANAPRNDASPSPVTWDNRFDIINLPAGCYISNLSLDEYSKLKKLLNLEKLAKDSNNNHKSILFTLPIIKNLEKVIAIPHISYYSVQDNSSSRALTCNIKAIFNPNFISRFTHFF